MYDLSGKIAVITGGAGLLGVKHAEAIAEIGGLPVLLDIDGEKAKTKAKNIGNSFGIEPYWIECDITNFKEVKKSLDQLIDHFGKVNILLNNAAIDSKVENRDTQNNTSRFEEFDINDWEIDFDVGVTGAFICTYVFGSFMAKQGEGVIINIGSDLSFIAPNQNIYAVDDLSEDKQPVKPFSYSVIKHSLVGLSKYFAACWALNGVRVNLLAPGGVWNDRLNKAFVNKLTKHIPIGRMANYDDYKGSIQFLCSDASSYMTGANLIVDGGRTIGSV